MTDTATEDAFAGLALTRRPNPYGSTFRDLLLLDKLQVRRVRELLSAWMALEPPGSLPGTLARLRSADNRQSIGAFAELVTGAALRRLFSVVERDPDIPGSLTRPDFRVQGSSAAVFEVAAVVEDELPIERLRRNVLRDLWSISSPWMADIRWDEATGWEDKRPSQIKRAVVQHLVGLTPEEQDTVVTLQNTRLPMHLWHIGGQVPFIGMDASYEGRMNPGVAEIKSIIGQKARRYRSLKLLGVPLVVVVYSDHLLHDVDSLFAALFGDETITFNLREGQVTSVVSGRLNLAGRLTPSREAARLTTVSAVWLVKRAFRRGRIGLSIVQAENPWAANPWRCRDRRLAKVSFRRSGGAVEFRKPEADRRLPLD